MSLFRLRPAAFAALCALSASALATDLPLTADTYVSTTAPAANYGSTITLNVGAGATALLRFDLSALPSNTLPSNVLKATLILYVNRVGVPGSVEVQTLGSAWTEGTVTAATVPTNDRSTSVPTAAVTTAGQYIAIDVTDKVAAWIAAGNASNFGFAIQPSAADPNTTVFFDSKENTGTGHVARLDLTMANQGPAGPQGVAGVQGPAGASTGVVGPAGAQGPAGPAGATGAAGAAGPSGAMGLPGPMGLTGPAGATGAAGAAGPTGAAGVAGPAGAQGPKGDTGPAGVAGPTGATGATGAAGVAGPVGPAGATGAVGPAGATGQIGPVGPTGAMGPAGATGAAGAKGATGNTGANGPQGPQGPQGPAGPSGTAGIFGANPHQRQGTGGAECTLGQVTLYAGAVGPGLPANGQLLSIQQYTALFTLFGTNFGGDGNNTFALPDLRSAAPNGTTYFVCAQGYYPGSL